jgi:ADP-heptose:LPS heptosyltransferase
MSLAMRYGFLDGVVDGGSRAFLGVWSGEALPSEVETPEGAVLWSKDPDATIRLLKPHASLPVFAVDPIPADPGEHVASYYCRSVAHRFHVGMPEDLTEGFLEQAPASRFVFIHPGSGGIHKCFSPEFYLGIANLLQGFGFDHTAFVMGPAERERGLAEAFEGETLVMPDSACGLADWLNNAVLYIGNDSGVSHLAAYMGIPCIVYYRTSDPAVWGALGKKVTWIRAETEASALQQTTEALTTGFAIASL